jgi:hypothetical protein
MAANNISSLQINTDKVNISDFIRGRLILPPSGTASQLNALLQAEAAAASNRCFVVVGTGCLASVQPRPFLNLSIGRPPH